MYLTLASLPSPIKFLVMYNFCYLPVGEVITIVLSKENNTDESGLFRM